MGNRQLSPEMDTQKQIHLINFCRKLTVNTLFFLIPLHLLKIGLNGWQIGAVVSLYGLAPLIFSFPIGWINDRLSIRRIIRSALLILSLLFLLLAITKNFYLLAVIFLFLGIANNALDVSTNSLYYKDETHADLNKKTILFSVLIFTLALHWGAEGTVYSPFLKSYFHLNNLQLSLYISISLFFLAFSGLAIAFLRFNAQINQRIFLFALFLSGAGHILMVNHNVYASLFFRIIHEIGDGLMGALIFLFISRLFQKKNIGGSSGILLALMTLGHMVGALVFSSIGYRVGLEYPFILSGLLLIANSVYGAFIFKKISY